MYSCPERCGLGAPFLTYGAFGAHMKAKHRTAIDDSNFDPSIILQATPNQYGRKSAQFQCSTGSCRRQFGNSKELENHRQHHGNFECQFCQIHDAIAFAQHEAKHISAEKGKICCSRCPQSYPLDSGKPKLVKHFLQKHFSSLGNHNLFNLPRRIFITKTQRG